MSKHRNVVLRSKFHRLSVKLCIHDGFAVLTDGRNSGFHHALDVGKLLSLLSLRHRTDLQHVGSADGLCFVVHIVHNIRIIHDRLGVRHGKNRRKSAVHCCPCACLDRLLLFKSRIS